MRSNARLVAMLCIAWFSNDDVCNPSDLSGCGTGPSSPLAHAKSALSPDGSVPAVYGQAYLAAFAVFPVKQHIAAGTFWHDVTKYHFMIFAPSSCVSMQDMNGPFLRLSAISLPFPGLRQGKRRNVRDFIRRRD